MPERIQWTPEMITQLRELCLQREPTLLSREIGVIMGLSYGTIRSSRKRFECAHEPSRRGKTKTRKPRGLRNALCDRDGDNHRVAYGAPMSVGPGMEIVEASTVPMVWFGSATELANLHLIIDANP